MGTIVLKVPQDIHVAYKIDSSKLMEQLLDWLKPLKKQSIENNSLLGLTDNAVDNITESAHEKHSSKTLSQREEAYAAAMQDYLSRPAKPLKNSQESYPPREALYDRGKFC